MDTGKHRREVDCESMYDRIRRKWAGIVTGVTFEEMDESAPVAAPRAF